MRWCELALGSISEIQPSELIHETVKPVLVSDGSAGSTPDPGVEPPSEHDSKDRA